ncbi:MAG TPA: hypothetical protein VIW29_13020, partial [Polyangiaceae bacterium]
STDSAGGKLHDVGTVQASSGMRAGEPLFGIDTPTLNGVWETAPYLHDGSAPTLRDVLTTANPEDRHAFTSALSEEELNQLVSYVQQLDGTVDPDADEPGSSAGGSSGAGGSSMLGAGAGGSPAADSGACSLSPSGPGSPSSVSRWATWAAVLAGAALWRARRRGSV